AGISGGEEAARGRLTALDAKTGQIQWIFYTIPAPGDPFYEGSWPNPNDPDPQIANAWRWGGATVWQAPAVDPELGMLYFSTGNAGPIAARRQPVYLVNRGSGLQDGPIQVALPGSPPRHLGLRPSQSASAVRHGHQRPAAQGSVPGQQDGLAVFPRSNERTATDRYRRDAGTAGSATAYFRDATHPIGRRVCAPPWGGP